MSNEQFAHTIAGILKEAAAEKTGSGAPMGGAYTQSPPSGPAPLTGAPAIPEGSGAAYGIPAVEAAAKETVVKARPSMGLGRKAVVGGGMLLIGYLAAALMNAKRRREWGELYGTNLMADRSGELQKEYQKRLADRNARIEEYQGKWKQEPSGAYIDPISGALVGERSYHARMGKMKQQAEAEEAKWLRDEFRKRTRKGTYVSPKNSAMDYAFQDWKQKYFNQPAWKSVLPIPFQHRGSFYLGHDNFWPSITGNMPPASGPDAEKRLRQIYLSGNKTIFGNPLFKQPATTEPEFNSAV